MRLFGFTITRLPKPIPEPPTRFCTCDSLAHLARSVQVARDALIAMWLLGQILPTVHLVASR